MKLASYRLKGASAFGVVIGDGVVTLNRRLGDKFATLRDVLSGNALQDVLPLTRDATPDASLSDIEFLPPIPNPDKILGIRANYKSLKLRTRNEFPSKPSIFVRLTNTLVAQNGNVIRPKLSEQFDYEGELAVVIGRTGRYIHVDQAVNYIAGYTCHNDITVRDYQKDSIDAGKNFLASGPIGPWMVTCDEIPDPAKLTLTTRLNGEVVQQSGTDMLHFSIPEIVSYLSEFTQLEPGDIIATGTPPGVGSSRSPKLWMKAGDEIEVEISSIGILRNRVIADSF
jgi:2-keto-4-pentenoate hydratase/2-oxohepta-3-ene-1,7-dioic acid hydratase in catechol pathway